MAAGWFCENFGWIGKVEDVKPVFLNKKRISTDNHFEEEDFYRMNCEIGGFHPDWYI
jgi:hypothetical protein